MQKKIIKIFFNPENLFGEIKTAKNDQKLEIFSIFILKYFLTNIVDLAKSSDIYCLVQPVRS